MIAVKMIWTGEFNREGLDSGQLTLQKYKTVKFTHKQEDLLYHRNNM